MQGRADKGLFITTGSFTSEAKKEAIRDGAPALDLIDGDALIEKLRNLGLGVTPPYRERSGRGQPGSLRHHQQTAGND